MRQIHSQYAHACTRQTHVTRTTNTYNTTHTQNTHTGGTCSGGSSGGAPSDQQQQQAPSSSQFITQPLYAQAYHTATANANNNNGYEPGVFGSSYPPGASHMHAAAAGSTAHSRMHMQNQQGLSQCRSADPHHLYTQHLNNAPRQQLGFPHNNFSHIQPQVIDLLCFDALV